MELDLANCTHSTAEHLHRCRTAAFCIVRRLELQNVHNLPAHTGCRNEATVSEALKLILLFSPDLGSRARAVEDPIDVRLHDLSGTAAVGLFV